MITKRSKSSEKTNIRRSRETARKAKNIIVIGSSTGGPKTLTTLFANLPRLDASVILVQHMPKFMNESLRKRLDTSTEMEVILAQEGSLLHDGVVYIAPSEVHLELVQNNSIRLFKGEKVNYTCPSIDVTMMSLQKNLNEHFTGVLLTGMGKDGADGLSHIKYIGGVTIAQSEQTCMIYGMPKAAAETGKVDIVLSPQEIKSKLIEMACTKS